MKITKGDQILDIKTGNSQMSDVDLFSKLQASFLEKFFKYNLIDYFSDIFINAYEDLFDRKMNLKTQKGLASSLFIANTSFSIIQLEKKLDNFYKSKSKSLTQGQLPHAFTKVYCNMDQDNSMIKQQQIIMVDVKIKAEVQKLQEVPQKILKCLSQFKAYKKQNLTQIQQLFTNYECEYINIFFVYFGDINFNLFNKKMYEVDSIKIMGNTYKFRIFVFFISKQGLIECFKTLNKIQNLNLINDLVIQFYELKREKHRRKKNKPVQQIQQIKKAVQAPQKFEMTHIALGVVGVVSLTIFGFAIKKIFF